MTWENRNARSAGPAGVLPGTLGGRLPGPLRFDHVDVSTGAPTKAVAAKVFAMPPPTSGSTSILRARQVDWDLAKDSPRVEDVLQGELANCPVAAILAAMANTPGGKARLNRLITEYTGAPVKTTFTQDILETLSAKTSSDPDYHLPDKELTSPRYFSVTLGSAIEVSDVFYIAYDDDPSKTKVQMVYMGSPKNALWPCVIEKAYAVKIGSYQDLDDDTKHTVNEFWGVLLGAPPQGFAIDAKTDLKKISDAAKAATKVPTIGASREDATRVESHHGFAILGLHDSTIDLYNPHGRKESVTLTEFRASFQAIFFAKV